MAVHDLYLLAGPVLGRRNHIHICLAVAVAVHDGMRRVETGEECGYNMNRHR